VAEVPVRALNQDTSGVLARVKAGEHLTITERGRPVARLVPAVAAGLADLVAGGRVEPPTLAGPLPRPTGPVRTDREAGELLEGLRDEERS
jgi:prevent-host-death family protein